MNQETNPNQPTPEIVEMNGRKYKKVFVGNLKGWDDEPLTEKRYYSHTGPGWDGHFGYLKNRGVSSLEELSDEPYVFELVEDHEKRNEMEALEKERAYNNKFASLLEKYREEISDPAERHTFVKNLLKRD